MNKSLIGALIVAMALLPSFASATNTAYGPIAVGGLENHVVPGTLLVKPTLAQDDGTAEIEHMEFTAAGWSVDVRCLSSSPEPCDGFIVS